MSSMLRHILLASPLIISVAAIAANLTPTLPEPQTLRTPQPSAAPVKSAPVPAAPGLAGAYMSWDRLRQTDSLSFGDYAEFLIAHPGWPGEARMRRIAENKADPALVPASQIVRFFDRFPPQSATARARHAEALALAGRMAEARQAARLAWVSGAIATADEARLLSRFGSSFTLADQDQRMERLLWQGSTGAAGRQVGAVSPAKRALFEARLAMQTKRADATLLADALGAAATRDPGFLIDKARWLRDGAQPLAARQLLAQPMTLNTLPLDGEKWLDTLLEFARAADADGQAALAFGIASNADKGFPAGADISQQSLNIRDDYTSLTWLAGQSAMRKLARPVHAVAMFDRYARGARTPQTQTKGWYWAGRAALAAGDRVKAEDYFRTAAAHGDQFYGQLAAERLGRPPSALPVTPTGLVPPEARAAFEKNELVQVARMLGQRGQWKDQTLFLRTIAQTVETEADHILSAELARAIGRPDLGVMVARNWRNNGAPEPISIGFPSINLSSSTQRHWTMIHAITRQESQFDRQIISHAGARGLMQLMPGTAQETAQKLGLPYDFERLTADPEYNVMLGSAFFARMLDNFGGNHVLAVAAYNAGPGNVRKWLRANGDPRMPGVDIVDWIEAIPFTETRGYVQRVLENAVVYDSLNPAGALKPGAHRLSAYLGKNTPG